MGQQVSNQIKKLVYHNKDKQRKLVEEFGKMRNEIPAMFFSWLAYNQFLNNRHIGLNYSEENFPMLKGFGQWKIVNEFYRDSKLEIIHGLIAVSESRKQVIIAFRGTMTVFNDKALRAVSINDWVRGCFDARRVPWRKEDKIECGRVHKGFMRHYRSVHSELIKEIFRYAFKGYMLIFTGHSQGACLATYAALECAECCTSKNIFLITFGSPRPGDARFRRHFNSYIRSSHVWHYITSYPSRTPVRDRVTSVPPSALGFRHIKGQTRYVLALKKEFLNPDVSTNISNKMPVSIECHFTNVYMAGLLADLIFKEPLNNSVAGQFTIEHKRIQARLYSAIVETQDAVTKLVQVIHSRETLTTSDGNNILERDEQHIAQQEL